MRVIVDLDSTLNNLIDEWLFWYNYTYFDTAKPEDIKSWDIHNYVNFGNEIYNFFDLPGAFYHLDILPDAHNTMHKLCSNHDVFIVSAFCRPMHCVEKYKWVKRFLPFFDTDKLVFCTNKSIVSGNIMIDDRPLNLDGFDGIRIAFDRPWNRDYLADYRAKSWEDVETLFRSNSWI